MGHLRDNGFEVTLHEVDDIAAHQEEHGVPSDMRGCHSALVGDLMVEGHVPADALMRFLEDDGGMAGISVPGIPSSISLLKAATVGARENFARVRLGPRPPTPSKPWQMAIIW